MMGTDLGVSLAMKSVAEVAKCSCKDGFKKMLIRDFGLGITAAAAMVWRDVTVTKLVIATPSSDFAHRTLWLLRANQSGVEETEPTVIDRPFS